LTDQQYMQAKNCGNLAELKSVFLAFIQFLEDTDYGPYMLSESPNMPISLLRSRLKKKLADEIDYVSSNATGILCELIDIMSIRYQIDNVVNLIEGLKNKVDY
jgi:V-type H+-transporting ATPase subunit d